MDKKEQKERMMGLIHFWAQRVISVPRNERQTIYAELNRESYDDAITANMSIAAAKDIANKMEEWTAALVVLIEQSGGKQGTA